MTSILVLFFVLTIVADSGALPLLNDTIRRTEDTISYQTYLEDILQESKSEPI